MKWRIFSQRPQPLPTPSEAGRALSARAKEIRRAERARHVKAHCASILASMQPKEPTT
jgi:hypothetical protein